MMLCLPFVRPFVLSLGLISGPPLAPIAEAIPKLLFLRQKVPLFLFLIVGKSLSGPGTGETTELSSSRTGSDPTTGLEGAYSFSPSLPNVMPSELFRLQKVPLFFLFKLGCELDSVLSAPGDAGRIPFVSGDVWFEDRRRALKDRRFLTLLGRLGLFEVVEGDEAAAETVVLN